MRKGKEKEEWDRLSYLIFNVVSLAVSDAKKLSIAQFHKFQMQKHRESKALTKDSIKNFKSLFKK